MLFVEFDYFFRSSRRMQCHVAILLSKVYQQVTSSLNSRLLLCRGTICTGTVFMTPICGLHQTLGPPEVDAVRR